MKHFLLLFSFLVLSFSAEAQLASGSKFTGQIKTKDINDNDVDIQADLKAGKTVILDIFATWCGPCWSFHNAGVLKELHKTLGAEGADKIRVYAIEADSRTPFDHLFSQVAGTSTVPSSLGDWTKDVPYSIINDHTFNTILNIAFFPTLYVIRPDQSVMEMGSYRYNAEIWAKALVPTAEKDLILSSSIDSKTFCLQTTFSQKPTVINMGTTPVASMDMSLTLNGEETLSSFATAVGVFEEKEISFGTKTIKETTEISVKIEGVDGVADEEDDLGEISGTFYRPLIKKDSLIVKFTTDFYPNETSWIIRDNKNRTVHSQPKYKAGTEDQFGGGGADANKEFTYKLPTKNTDINCLTLTITDSYGDGMTAFNASHPIPGVEIYNTAGDLLKPKINTDYNFQSAAANTASTTKIFVAADFTSSLEDAEFVENLSVYPNPATDILNVNMVIKSGVEYQIFISDVMGARVTDIVKNTNFINVANLSSGMYFINVQTKDGLYTHKFSKI
jgi:thiol-disulfide isomerase/thioredoxin